MRRFQIVPSISNSRCVFQQSRNFANASSFYNKKMYQANHDSARQAKDYMDRVQPPELHRKVDSMLRPKSERVKNEQFDYLKDDEFFGAKVSPNSSESIESIGELLQEEKLGELRKVNVMNLCEITVSHDDIFDSFHRSGEAYDLTIIPMSPNFMPYKGIGLKALERGGEDMYRAVLKEVRDLLQIKKQNVDREVEELAKEAGVSVNQFDKTDLQRQISMQPGEIVVVKTENGAVETPFIGFLVMPFFFQGNPLQASKALGHAWASGLKHINELGIRSAISVHPGKGIYGYDVPRHAEILMENSFEQMLQLNELAPKYSLQKLKFVDSSLQTAKDLSTALNQQECHYHPEKRLVSAAEWHSHHETRLLTVPASTVRKCRRSILFKFKKHHAIVKRTKTNYRQNIRPYKWRRSGFLLEAPSLQVYEHSGIRAAVEEQLPARPLHKGLYDHTYTPSPKSTFGYSMRVTAAGNLRGLNRLPRTWDGLDRLDRTTRNETD